VSHSIEQKTVQRVKLQDNIVSVSDSSQGFPAGDSELADDEKPPSQYGLDSLSKTVALGGTGCLLLSILYDWGFLRALGLSFATLPTSLSDHLRGALNWLPGALIYLGFAGIYELVSRRIEGGLTEEELIASSKRPTALRKFRESPQKAFGILTTAVIVLWIVMGDQFREGLWLAVPIAWMNFSVVIVSHKRLRERTPRRLLFGFAFLPAVVASVFLYGDHSGHTALKDSTAPAVSLVPEASDAKRHLVLIRVFEHAAIVRDEGGTITVIRTPDILQIQPPTQTPYKGLLCPFWRRVCTLDSGRAH
jgi:hypothetical protein